MPKPTTKPKYKDHAVLAVAEGRYDLDLRCRACGFDGVQVNWLSSEDCVQHTCARCGCSWTNPPLDSYPVEPMGELFHQFNAEQAQTLVQKASIEAVLGAVLEKVSQDLSQLK